ncbi:MAG: EAL domain-containing protein [Lachnospiraceae bacterium]|nr:EAL domain-containing protein [Lachnospiraceae bacterium]
MTNNAFESFYAENMPAAAFVCRADGQWEILYASQSLVKLMECENYEDFMEFTGGSFGGMVSPSQFRSIYKEILLQVHEEGQTKGHLFYHLITKKENVCLAEEYWKMVRDPEEGMLFYSFLLPRENDPAADYDPITGLYGKARFVSHANNQNREMIGTSSEEYAVAYLNLVNFKLLNVNKGIEEGDACLKAVADSLSYAFEDAILARLSDDHFAILDKKDNLIEKMKASRNHFHEMFLDRFGVSGKWGYYTFTPSNAFDAEKALSFAKIACDKIKYVADKYIIEYSEQLAQQQNLAEHLVRSFDDALKNGWVQVYFQPVIRAITGELCGVESLARWNDPQFGFIMPGDFISVLEESRLIYKLDSFVVEEVCKLMHERVQQKLNVVPVSVNFSRLDFVTCDMLKVVETAVEKYDIPRDYIHIEVTESMIASDAELMRSVIDSFRAAGYEIWMDDFGSGYSSLTVLKDYQFDMLKLDMNFLSNFTDKSKDVMRSAIIMAKDLGIKTLAEGVETKEQFDYLRSIGCDQIQGYLYGKPEPLDVFAAHIREKKIIFEQRKWRHFYEVASFHVKATDAPLELIEDDGTSFRTLFMNEAYKEQIGLQGMSLEEVDKRIYHAASPLLGKYREFAEQMKRTGKQETFYYSEGNSYLCLRGEALVQLEGRCIIKASIINIAADQNLNESERLDNKLRALNLLFKVILHADVKNQQLTPLLGTSPNMRSEQTSEGDVDANNAAFAENNIFPTERNRYRAFMDFSTAKERVEKSRFDYVSDVFRINQPDGNYRRGETILMVIPGTDGNEFLYCVKPYIAVQEDTEGVSSILRPDATDSFATNGESTYRLLWNNMVWNSSVKFFWKDRERKFMGASQAFLDFFGFRSLEELVGKTDADMRWFVNETPYRERELDILHRGIRFLDEPMQVIVKGTLHNIICYKMPIYKDGLIVGISGYFLDAEKEMGPANMALKRINKDSVTGLMDAHAFVGAMADYEMQYHEKRKNYGLIIIRNARYYRIVETYGEEVANESLREMTKVLMHTMGTGCVMARSKGGIFATLMHVDDEAELKEKAEKLLEEMSKINTADGNPVTMRMRVATRVRSAEGVTDENMYYGAIAEVMEDKAEEREE